MRGWRGQLRSAGGRWRRATMRDLGLRTGVHERRADGAWCGQILAAGLNENLPRVCPACGEPINPKDCDDDDEEERGA